MKNIIRHGEVVLKPVNSLPEGVTLVKETKKEIVAHSETGHHHTLVADRPFNIYKLKEDTFIEIYETAKLIHEKSGPDIHTPHKIVPGIYKIQIKKAFDYFAGVLKNVRD